MSSHAGPLRARKSLSWLHLLGLRACGVEVLLTGCCVPSDLTYETPVPSPKVTGGRALGVTRVGSGYRDFALMMELTDSEPQPRLPVINM